MKRIFTLLVFCVIASLQVSAQSRLVFIEEFTQASCPPCEATTPALNAVINANAEKLVQIRYHTSWPGVDPMNADNQSDVQARVDFYGVTGVPNLRIDGAVATGSGNQLVTPAEIDNRYAVASDIAMTLTHTLSDANDEVTVSLSVTNNGSGDYQVAGDKLRVALVEEEVSWPFTPGSTSLTVFEAVMKEFLTGVAGMDLPVIAAGETYTNEWTAAVPATTYDTRELAVVAWIQNDGTRNLVNSAESHPVDINPDYLDAGIENTTVAPSSYCDEGLQPSIKVVNSGVQSIQAMEVAVVQNNEVVALVPVDQALAAGEEADINLPEIAAAPGANTYSYFIASVNGSTSADLLRWDDQSESTFAAFYGDYGTFEEGFETLAFGELGDFFVEAPTNLAFITVTPQAFGLTTPIGSGSQNSALIDFWTWNTATLAADGFYHYGEVDMTDMSNIMFSFDRAGAIYQGAADRLAIEVSTDCGGSWTELWAESGAALSTNGTINDARFVPNAGSTWTTAEIDMSAYAGESAVAIRFRATSDYGNSLYIDNISLQASVSTDDILSADAISVYPNPASDFISIDVNDVETSEIDVQLLAQNGQVIYSQQGLATTGARVDVSSLPTGLYMVRVIAGDKSGITKVSVIK